MRNHISTTSAGLGLEGSACLTQKALLTRACTLVLLLFLVVGTQAQNGRKTLRTIHEVNQLSNIEARNAYPVQLEGVATYSDPEWGLLFVQDSTGSIYVNVHGMTASYPPGSRLRVDAVTGPGDVGTVLVSPKIQELGPGGLPSGERHSLAELSSRTADSHFVQTQGVLRAGDQPWQRVCFRVFDGNTSALVVVPQAASLESRRLVGARVRIRGVSGVHIDSSGKVVGTMLFVNRLSDIEAASGAAQNPNALAVIVNKNNPVNDLSMAELRRILLGERQSWSHSHKIVLLLPGFGTSERITTLRLVGMDEASFKERWTGSNAPVAAPASGFAVTLVSESPDALALVPLADVRGSVKLLKIDGYLPSDATYPVH